jgi:hypothetical protein
MQPKVHIVFSPGSACAVSTMFYVESGPDIFGWHAESIGNPFSAAYFMIENYYANSPTLLHRSLQDDLYGRWITDFPPSENAIRCPLPEPMQHKLERFQFDFVEDWLFFRIDPAAANEIEAYHKLQLSVQSINIKSRKLKRLHKAGATLTHTTPGTDLYIVDYLENHLRFRDMSST